MYYFNAWHSEYKQPFGAIQVGSVMNMNFKVTGGPAKVKLIIRRDFGQRHEFDMQKMDDELYSVSVKFDVGAGLYFYYFEISEPSDWGVVKHYYGSGDLGGEGVLYMAEHEIRPYQITCISVPDPAPDWYRESVFYQIFPDRFHNGNPDGKINHPKKNSFIYGTQADEPFYVKDEQGHIVRWDFFGGNLQGIIQKIPYLKELGVTAIYLNPIFSGTSNHRYDTNDYLEIDSMLGTEEDFKALVKALHDEGMRLVLDGVFSHVGKNSRYFNLSGDYGDDEGAAKNPNSPYFSWFKFNDYPNDYKSWWGIVDLPEVDKDNEDFQAFIYGNPDSVLDKWTASGIDGWRLDVADELPDSFIRGIREKLKTYPDKVLIGEVWEDASNKISYGQRRDYILGDSLHGVMNYPFRDMILAFLRQELSAHDIAHQMMMLKENYPEDVLYNNLNNLGSHDTERIISMVGEDRHAMAVAMLYSLPGVPCLYYGDEAGLTGLKDPSNRKYFPWDNIKEEPYQAYKGWIAKRKAEAVLTKGDFSVFYTGDVLGILRFDEETVFATILNPTDRDVTLYTEDINCLQNLSFAKKLAEALDEKVMPLGSAVDFKMKL
ncbi:glycoside hydrolase family 13 protein [Lactococcus termiticola]|uniref:Amylopullulanase n=1 Tax=Lactococcus termiticola TaxID=2169526 RepID=A0A2R5HFC2_9LACT|nr:glycoside hydrolase family 13 protein [Lactococcus termiticola]GBG96773.1 amylopullulanase [Lactococcus termiticola]